MSSKNFQSLIQFLDLIKFDFCALFFSLGYTMQNTVVTQLMEDKFCLNQLQLNDSFCDTFALNPNATETHLILQAASTFKRWQSIMSNSPTLVLAIFLGYWLGHYPRYFKQTVVFPLVGNSFMIIILLVNVYVFEASAWFLLLSYVPFALSGGIFVLFSAIYTSITWGTPSHLVIVRFSLIEFFVKMAMMGSSYASGEILIMDPWIAGQRKNYSGVFIVALIINLMGTFWAILMKPNFTFDKDLDNEDKTFGQMVDDVFRFSRVKQMMSIFMVPRPNKGRARLILILTSGALCNATLNGEENIAYQFAQRVYGLSEEAYTSMLTLVYIPPTIGTSIGPTIMKFLGLSDASIALIGCISLSLFFIIRGFFLTLRGYISGYVIGSLGRTSSVAIRSLIVSTVDPTEAAQIFTISTALETYVVFGSAFAYTSVFSITIGEQPGAVMILAGIVLIYPFIVCCWVRLTQSNWMSKSVDGAKISHIVIDQQSEQNLNVL